MFDSDEKKAEELAVVIAEKKAEAAALELKAKKARNEAEAAIDQLAQMMTDSGQEAIKFKCGLHPRVEKKMVNYKQAEASWSSVLGFLEAHGHTNIPLHWTSMNARVNELADMDINIPEEIINRQETKTIRLNGQSKYWQLRQEHTNE